MTQTLYVDAPWEGEIKLSEEILIYLQKHKIQSLGLFASVQFLQLDRIKKQLEQLGISIHTSKAKRANVPVQILGCDMYHDSFDANIFSAVDILLYIGDGLFHPKALLLSQIIKDTCKPVLIWDPIGQCMSIISQKDIQQQVNKTMANLKKFLLANTIGILVTVKPGQQYLANALKLEEEIKKKGKQAYIFIDDTLDLRHMENYPFVDVWVNTACPRIGADDQVHAAKPLINIREACNPEEILFQLQEKWK